MNRLQTLLSNSTCAATHRLLQPSDCHLAVRPLAGGAAGQTHGRAVQVDSIKTRVESAYGFSA